MSALEDLTRVCRMLGQDPLAPVDAAEALGTISADLGPDLPIEFVPSSPAFTAGKVIREFGVEAVGVVSLKLAEPMEIEQLAAQFGEGKRARDISIHAPRTMTYRVPQPEQACDCTVIAELRRAGEKDVVVGFSVRRTKR